MRDVEVFPKNLLSGVESDEPFVVSLHVFPPWYFRSLPSSVDNFHDLVPHCQFS